MLLPLCMAFSFDIDNNELTPADVTSMDIIDNWFLLWLHGILIRYNIQIISITFFNSTVFFLNDFSLLTKS